MTFDNLLIERDGAVAIVTFNRPKVLNALNTQTLTELAASMASFKDDSDVRAIVLTGAGEKSFVAGADINELAVLSPVAGKDHARRGQQIFDAIEQLGKPVIAAVNGFALGGGCELAMSCHVRLASEAARFGQPEVKLGVTPGYGGTQRLTRLVGRGRALQLLLTGEMIDAAEAYRIGLVNRVVPAGDSVVDAARALLQQMLANAPLALAHCIEAVNRGSDIPLDEALALEAASFGLLATTEDMQQGTAAFLEKRAPVFKGG